MAYYEIKKRTNGWVIEQYNSSGDFLTSHAYSTGGFALVYKDESFFVSNPNNDQKLEIRFELIQVPVFSDRDDLITKINDIAYV